MQNKTGAEKTTILQDLRGFFEPGKVTALVSSRPAQCVSDISLPVSTSTAAAIAPVKLPHTCLVPTNLCCVLCSSVTAAAARQHWCGHTYLSSMLGSGSSNRQHLQSEQWSLQAAWLTLVHGSSLRAGCSQQRPSEHFLCTQAVIPTLTPASFSHSACSWTCWQGARPVAL